MNGLIVIICIIAVAVLILYFVIKAAVRNGIIEAHSEINNPKSDDADQITQITCPECGKEHDMDYPKCPYCKHKY